MRRGSPSNGTMFSDTEIAVFRINDEHLSSFDILLSDRLTVRVSHPLWEPYNGKFLPNINHAQQDPEFQRTNLIKTVLTL